MITCQFVRPDKLMFEGEVDHLILVTETGELGIWPGHSPLIAALGNGMVRLHLPESEGGGQVDVIVSHGYAEVSNNTVIVLANHARRSDDIEPEVVQQTKDEAIAKRDALPEGDHGRAYYDDKIAWCDMLLAHAGVSV